MTRAELITLMRSAWTGDAASGLCDPLTEAQVAMIDAQLGAIADGILAAAAEGGTSFGPMWFEQAFAETGSTFTLTHVPVSGSLMVFRNDLPERGWTLVNKTLTLGSARTTGDASLWVRYQAVVPN